MTFGGPFAIAPSASAADGSWTGLGADTNWGTAANWSGNAVPSIAGTATFNGAGNGGTTINVGTQSINRILFDTASAAAYTLGVAAGTGTISLDENYAGGTVTMNATVANDQLINTNLILGLTGAASTAYTFTNNSGNRLTVAGAITGGSGGTAGPKTLLITGTGSGVTLAGNISNGGATTLALTFGASGNSINTTWLVSGTNTYGGVASPNPSTTLASGTLQVGSDSALGTGIFKFIGASAGGGAVQAYGGARTISNDVQISTGNAVVSGGQNLTFTGAVTGFNNNRTLSVTNTGLTTLAGNLYLSESTAARTFTVGSSATASPGTLLISGVVANNNAGNTGASNFVVGGGGTNILTGTNTYTGTTTVQNANTVLQLGNGGTTGALSTSSAITVTTGNLTINRSNAVVQGTDFSGSGISGTGSFTQAGSGTTTFNAANTYTGTTTVTAGTLQIRGGSAIANNSAVSLGGGTLSIIGASKEGSAATVTGGVASGTNTVGLGALTLTTNSTLDFDNATNGNTLVFANGFSAGTSVVTITNWANPDFNGTTNSGLSTDDRLIFNQNMATFLGAFDFGGGAGVGVSQISLGGGFYELGFSPVPEPSTWVGGLLLCAAGSVPFYRRLTGCKRRLLTIFCG